MPKLQLGQAPKSFQAIVLIPVIDGEPQELGFTFKYRSRTEYAKFIQPILTPKEEKADKDLTLLQVISKSDAASVKFIMDVAEGWDLTDKFNATNVGKLVDEFPAAPAAISEAYSKILLEGRVKN